jgi:hypothetical protein
VTSGDGGLSWEDCGAPFPVRSLAVDTSGLLYVGTDGGGLYTYSE